MRYVQPFLMQSSFHLFESFGTFCDKYIREDISPTLNINVFIFSTGVIYLTNKYSMNVKYHVLFSTLHFSLKKQFKYLSFTFRQFTGDFQILYTWISLSLYPKPVYMSPKRARSGVMMFQKPNSGKVDTRLSPLNV